MLDVQGNLSASESDEAASLNPFCALGPPGSPLRMMFAPFEVATFLPAYAFDTFHCRRSGRR